MEAHDCQAENVESNFSFSLRTCFFTQFLQMNRKKYLWYFLDCIHNTHFSLCILCSFKAYSNKVELFHYCQ